MNQDIAAYWAAVRSDLMVFLKQAFTTIYDGREILDNWHLDAIVGALEDSIAGKSPRLIINLPPRHLKSFIASVVLPAFVLGNDPSARVIVVSYSDDLARALSLDFKRLIESEWYQRLFPEFELIKNTEGEVRTSKGGGRYTTSVGATLTGRGADLIIIDDPIKPDDAQSDARRRTVNEWYRTTLLSRLEDKERSMLVIVMQRLHVNDLVGFVEADGGFRKLSFPAIAGKDEVVALRHGRRFLRREGEALHEAWEGIKTLERIRREIGPFTFASQYQQTPTVPDGAIFQRKWFQLVDERPPIQPDGVLYVSIDSAASTSETADYSAISLVYVLAKDYYVFGATRGRWDYEKLKSIATNFLVKYGPDIVFVVEAASTGISLCQFLRDQGHSCFHYRPKADKMGRALQAIPYMAEGRVHLVTDHGTAAWVEPYLTEFVNFPFGRYDDQVDSLTQLMAWGEARHNPKGNIYFLGERG